MKNYLLNVIIKIRSEISSFLYPNNILDIIPNKKLTIPINIAK